MISYWDGITKFSSREFPEDPEMYAERDLVFRLNKFRLLLGKPINPSPVKGALARFDGSKTSKHYVDLVTGKKSTGVDIFAQCDPLYAYMMIQTCGLFGGIGVYFDTVYDRKPHIMFHIDLRSRGHFNQPTVWFRDWMDSSREERKYYYEREFKSPEAFHGTLITKFMARR